MIKFFNQLKKLYVDQQSDLLTLQKSLSTLEENRESFQNNILVWTEQDKSAEINIQRLKLSLIHI